MVSRGRLLVPLPAFATSLPALAALPFRRPRIAPPSHIYPLYIGTDTSKNVAKGVYFTMFDAANGHLSAPVLAAETPRPAFFALASARNGGRFLYVGNETGEAATSTITTFAVDPNTHMLHQRGQVPAGFAGPCYVTADATGKAVFAASYAGSGLSSYRILPDGTLSQPVEKIDYKDESRFGKQGPNHVRQDAPHPHSATLSPDDRFLVVNDLGNDQITIFSVDPETAKLSLGEPHLFSNGRPGSGPRHVAFHPNGRWVYGINEIESTIDHYLWTTTHSVKSPQALLVVAGPPVKTIDGNFPADKNTAAELAISPNGYFLYASNRGENSLVVFKIDQASGALEPVQRISCGGKTPRHFLLDPTGQWLICGNQDSATMTVFRRDGSNGRLGGPVATLPIDSPMYALFA